MKRTRPVETQLNAGGTEECPVCFGTFNRTEIQRPFACTHVLCGRCDAQMLCRGQHRCPMCRTARTGMRQEDAEPDPEPTETLLPPAHVALQLLHSTFGLARQRASTVMFFRRETPIELDRNGHEVFREVSAERVYDERAEEGTDETAGDELAQQEGSGEEEEQDGGTENPLLSFAQHGDVLAAYMPTRRTRRARTPRERREEALAREAAAHQLVEALRNIDSVPMSQFQIAHARIRAEPRRPPFLQ